MINPIKKFASVVVVAAMLISCFSVVGGALGGTPTGTEAMSIGVALSDSEVEPGDIVTVTVSASNNYNAVTMRWPVLYSKAFFELVTEDGVPAITTPIDSATAVAGSTTVGEDEGFIPAAYNAEDYGVLAIQWIAKGDETAGVGAFSSATAVPCFTFRLRVKADASDTGSVFIPSDSDKFYYTGITDTADVTTSYTSVAPFNFTFSAPQTACVATASAEPVLRAADGYEVQTITFDGDDTVYLCGFNVEEIVEYGEDFRNQFYVENGTYEVSDEMFATGVVVTVYDNNGGVYAEYPIIFFGDIDGNGTVDNYDYSDIISISNFERFELDAYYYAADLYVEDEAMANIDTYDIDELVFVCNYEKSLSSISQTHSVV